jgi:hypothetical protein
MFLGIALLMAFGVVGTAASADQTPPAVRWIPRDTVATLEIVRPKDVVGLALESKLTDAVSSHPLFKHATLQPGFVQFRAVVSFVEGQLGTDWKTALKKLTAGGVTAAITSKGVVIVVIDSEDAKLLTQLQEMIVGFAKQNNPDGVKSAEYKGATCWELADGQTHTVLGGRFISASKPEGLKAVLDTKVGSEQQSLLSLPAYQAAKKAAGAAAAARAYLNLGIVKQLPGVKAGLDKNTNPVGALLFAGLIDSLRQSNWLALALKIDGETLSLETTLDGKVSGKSELAAFARSEKPQEGAFPNLAVPRMIAGMSFYRDLHGFYAAKDKLFPERTSGLIFFENMMGIFFSGRDLTDEVLAQFRPEIRFVVAEQKFDPEIGVPQIQLPAFALVLKVFRPKEAAELMEEAFQKAIGLVSFTSGQKGVPGYIVDRPTHADVRYTVAYVGKPRGTEKGPLAMRYNFRPSLVSLGDSVVISSAESLARDLIDALKKEMSALPKALHETDSLIEVNATQVASILSANRAALVRQNIMEKGSSQREAEANIDLLLGAVKLLGKTTISLGQQDDKVQARLTLKLNP